MPVFDQLLGSSYAELPTAVREFHEHQAPHYSGTAYSGGSNSTLARLLRKIFGFPIVSDQLAVDIWPEYKDGRDHWRRRFGEQRFASSFFTAPDGVLDERFGPFRFGFRLRAQDNRLYWDFIRWSLGPVRLPRALGPTIETYETQSENGGFEFYSHADFPVIGRLVHYHGIVHPVSEPTP